MASNSQVLLAITNLVGAMSTLTGALDAFIGGFFDYETAATVPTSVMINSGHCQPDESLLLQALQSFLSRRLHLL